MATFVIPQSRTLLFVPSKCGSRYFATRGYSFQPWDFSTASSWRTIAVVRDPRHRFISALMRQVFDPVLPGELGEWSDSSGVLIADFLNSRHYNWRANPVVATEEFVLKCLPQILAQPRPDTHFEPQVRTWQFDGAPDIHIQHWVRMVNLSSAAHTLLGITPSAPENKRDTWPCSASSTQLLTPRVKQALEEIYAEDFRLWRSLPHDA